MSTPHGRQRSLWWTDGGEEVDAAGSTTPDTTDEESPFREGRSDWDAVVIGAGIAGLMIAAELADGGRSVCIVEARRVGAGVTGSSTAKVSALHGATYHEVARRRGDEAAAVYAAANLAGVERYEQLVRQHGIDCGWSRIDAATYATTPGRVDAIERELAAAAAAGLPVIGTSDLGTPFGVEVAVVCPDQAMVDPVRFCHGLAAALRRTGVRILEGIRVRNLSTGELHVAHGDRASFAAPLMVLATQLPVHDPGLFFARCSPVRSYALAATLAEPVPEVMSLSVDDPARSMRPAELGSTVGVFGGGSHRVGEGGDTRRFQVQLERWVREHFDVRSIDARWSAQDYEPPDGVPFIGRMPHTPEGLYVATGFKKWGFTTAAIAGRIIADLADGLDDPWTATFDATRLASDLSGSDELLQSNAKVALHFIGDRLATLRPRPLGEVAPGEGAIVEVDGEKLAAQRDDGGELHLVSARCAHLGCLVAWNAAEGSWDCPCHGSRFDADGCVLTGPATFDLPRRSAPEASDSSPA